MRIVLATGLYPPDIGGPATYAELLVQTLPQHAVTVTVVPYGTVRSLPKWRRHLTYTYRLWRATKDCDGIYALDPISVGLPARLVAWWRQTPLLVRLGGDYAWEQGVQRFGVHDTLDEYTERPHLQPRMVRTLAAVQRFVVRGATAVIVPSHYLKQIVSTWQIDKDKIHVIYSAHNVSHPVLDRAALRAQFACTEPTLVSIARLTPWKGMDTLIELVARRVTRGETTTLIIAGDGPERSRLEKLARERGVSAQVRFVGVLTSDAVYALVTAADVFLLDTRYEGLSHQLIEVMTLGTPIVTTPVGGNPELITDGVHGVFVSPGDVAAYDTAVTKLLADRPWRESLVAAARTRAEDFAGVDAVVELAALLRKVIAS